MRDLIQEILEAEKSAEELIQNAREQAAHIKAQADTETKSMIAEARAKAQKLAGETVREIRAEAEKTRMRKVEEAEKEGRALVDRSDVSLDELANQVAQMILETDLD